MVRRLLLLAVLFGSGCVTLSPDGARVAVYTARLGAVPRDRRMPEGCRRLAAKPTVSMTELEMDGQHDPYREARNEAGAAGANALLVLSRLTVPRRNPECPGSVPITDCPPSEGAWYDVVFESYVCTPDALQKLDAHPETVAAADGS
jgi:hypothetical protein